VKAASHTVLTRSLELPTVVEQPELCRVPSCRNRGSHRIEVWLGGEKVEFRLCGPHNAEYRAGEVRP
jgi:hypothetical protein